MDDTNGATGDLTQGLECRALDLLGDMPPAKQAAVLRVIVDDLPDAIVVHRVNGEILFFNDGACRLLGYSHDEIVQLAPFGWIAPEVQGEREERLDAILEQGTLTFESAVLQKDGSVTPTEVSARRAESDEGPLIVSVMRDITRRKSAEERLVYLAFHDSLTGLPNRAALDERLRTAIAEARRHKDLLVLAYIDLDQFKPINDRYGHEVGDEALVTLATRMSDAVREQDYVSRIGGDEFVVVLPRLRDTAELAPVARRLLAEIRQPIKACDYECRITASIGFAVFDPAVDDSRTLIVKADVAMYAAKRDPMNPWIVWKPGLGMSVPGM